MASGEGVWFEHPERTRILPMDLRVHLSRLCRYNGALDWSVLQHLALCVELGTLYSYRPGVFRTKLTEKKEMPGEGTFLMSTSRPPKPIAVRVAQTPAEARCTASSNYPRFDWLDVENRKNRRAR